MPTVLLFLLASLLAPSLAVASEAQYLSVGRDVMVHSGADVSDTPLADDDPGWTAADWQALRFRDAIWLRAVVEVPPGFATGDHPMGLSLNAAASAEVWWDGAMIGRNGRPESTAVGELPGRIEAVFMLDDRQLREGEHRLLMRLSRQHGSAMISTPIDQLSLGPWEDPLDDALRYYLPSVLSGGAVVLAGLFLLVTGWRSRDPAALWLSASCLALLLQLGFESLRGFVNYPYPWHGPRLVAIAASAWLFGFSLVGFFMARLRTPRPIRWQLALGLLALLPFFLSGDVVAAAVLLVFLGGSLLIAGMARKNGHPDAMPFLVVLALLLALLLLQTAAFLDRWLYVGFSLVLMLFFADHVRLHFRTVRERDAARHAAQRLELDLLKQHLKPHFLMNTLTALAGWIEESPRTAVRMVDALADEFRTLIDVSDRAFVTLEEELALCRAHLEVMGFRRDRAFVLDARLDPGSPVVPPAVLHTLIENAITHGGNVDAPASFVFTARKGDRSRWRLRLDCPAGAEVGEGSLEGTGLAYVRARLAEAFGEDWRLQHGVSNSGGWFTEIEIPGDARCT
ncbi:sensor histidine kinase [Luteimonas soli]|uniref:Sensor histidine kinase n=1 Tax=Luteimonas soli TaxID=1648966 RepID=A0ABV7XF24_9GAMM